MVVVVVRRVRCADIGGNATCAVHYGQSDGSSLDASRGSAERSGPPALRRGRGRPTGRAFYAASTAQSPSLRRSSHARPATRSTTARSARCCPLGPCRGGPRGLQPPARFRARRQPRAGPPRERALWRRGPACPRQARHLDADRRDGQTSAPASPRQWAQEPPTIWQDVSTANGPRTSCCQLRGDGELCLPPRPRRRRLASPPRRRLASPPRRRLASPPRRRLDLLSPSSGHRSCSRSRSPSSSPPGSWASLAVPVACLWDLRKKRVIGHHHEQLHLDARARRRIHEPPLLAGAVDERLLSGPVRLAHHRRQPGLELPIQPTARRTGCTGTAPARPGRADGRRGASEVLQCSVEVCVRDGRHGWALAARSSRRREVTCAPACNAERGRLPARNVEGVTRDCRL